MVLLSYVDHTLQRPSYGAKLHGRGDVVMLLAQALVVAVFSLTSAEDSSSLWFRFVSLVLLAAGWLNAYVMWQPHIAGMANDIRAALGGMFAWATLCAFVVLASSLVDVTGLLFGGLVPAAVMAGGGARVRRFMVQHTPVDKLQSMADAHRWALERLNMYARIRDNRVSPDLQVVVTVLGAEKGHSATTHHSAVAMPGNDYDSLQRRKGSGRPGVTDVGADQDSDSGDSIATARPGRSLGGAKHALVTTVGGADYRSVHMSSQLRAALVDQADEAFQVAAGLPGSQPLAHFARSLFLRHFRNSRYTEFAALRAAKASSPGFDVAFFVYQRHRQLNEAKANTNSSGEASLSAIDRLLYEQHSQDAADAGLEWSIGQARLWGSLAESEPHMDDLHTHTITLASALLKADTAYNAMRRLNPNSSALLRAVGQYMVGMRGDGEAGEMLLAQADRMEQVALQRSQQVVKRFVYSQVVKRGSTSIDETSASITLSGSVHNLGQVLDANAAASHVFGCSRSALLSKRFPDLFPPVLAQAMDAAMYEYTSRGTGLDFHAASLRLVLSSTGSLVPVVMQLAEVPSVEDSDVVNFQLAREAYRINSLTPGGAAALGVDLGGVGGAPGMGHGAGLEDDVVMDRSLLRYFPELDLEQASNLFGLSLHVALTALRESLARNMGPLPPPLQQGASQRSLKKDTHSLKASSSVVSLPLRGGGARGGGSSEVVVTDVLRSAQGSPGSPMGHHSINLQGQMAHVQVHPAQEAFLATDVFVVCWTVDPGDQVVGAPPKHIATVAQGLVNAQRSRSGSQSQPQKQKHLLHVAAAAGGGGVHESKQSHRQPVLLLGHDAAPSTLPPEQQLPMSPEGQPRGESKQGVANAAPGLAQGRSASHGGGGASHGGRVSPMRKLLSSLGSSSFTAAENNTTTVQLQPEQPMPNSTSSMPRGHMAAAVAPHYSAHPSETALLDDAAASYAGSWTQAEANDITGQPLSHAHTEGGGRGPPPHGVEDNPRELKQGAASPAPSLLTRSADSIQSHGSGARASSAAATGCV